MVMPIGDHGASFVATLRMTTTRLLSMLCLLVVLGACAQRAKRLDPTPRPDPLILVSIDGFRADYIDRGFTPTLAALAAHGVRAESMKPAFPTLTFPNHYTLVTGLYPDHHGIVDNRMRDPATGRRFVYKDLDTISDPAWWGGEPIWVGAERHGLRADTLFWPGSEVAIGGVRPQRWLHFDASMTATARVEQLLRWMDAPLAERASFYTLYFDQVDHAGHAHGPDSPDVDAALRDVDAALATLVEGLRRRGRYAHTNIVVVSDHGMTATSPDRVVYLDDLVAPATIDVVTYGVLAGIDAVASSSGAAEATLLRGQEHMTCWRKSDLPARLHYGTNPRIPALLCLADDGWIISSHANEKARSGFPLGEHGYDNDDPLMRALFVAEGPAFLQGIVVRPFDSVDVYALLAKLLNVPAAANDGDFNAVAAMLRSPSR